MSVETQVKKVGRSWVFHVLIGAVVGATLLYVPINKVITWAKAKFHRGTP